MESEFRWCCCISDFHCASNSSNWMGIDLNPCSSCSLLLKKHLCMAAAVLVFFVQGCIDLPPPLIKIQVTVSSRTHIHSLLYFTHNESDAMSTYSSPCSPIMAITSATMATPITVTPILENCPETWGETRAGYRLNFIDLDSAYRSWFLILARCRFLSY